MEAPPKIAVKHEKSSGNHDQLWPFQQKSRNYASENKVGSEEQSTSLENYGSSMSE